MKINKLTWVGTLTARFTCSIPDRLTGRVELTEHAEGFLVEVDGKPATRVFVDGGFVTVERGGSFVIGSSRRGDQMEELHAALLGVVFHALGLRRGWCGNWGYPDGTRVDGRGTVERAPIEAMMDIMDALDRAVEEPPK